MIPEDPNYHAIERARQIKLSYLYVIRDVDANVVLRVTSADRDITVGGSPPSFWGGSAFAQSTVKHENIKISSDSATEAVTLTVSTTYPMFERFFIAAPTTRIWVDIYRCNQLDFPSIPDNLQLIFAGELAATSFSGYVFGGTFTPRSLNFDRQFPRFTYQRTCNYDLYGPGCGVNPSSFQKNATIVAASQYKGMLTVTMSGNPSALLFANGYFIEPTTKSNISIVSGVDLDSTNRAIFVAYWIPELATIGAVLSMYQGCSKTLSACSRFSNTPNFGGTPNVPVQNPSIDGVA